MKWDIIMGHGFSQKCNIIDIIQSSSCCSAVGHHDRGLNVRFQCPKTIQNAIIMKVKDYNDVDD